MAEYDFFTHSKVQYPLAAATTNPLVNDVDPVLRHMVDFFAAVIHAQVGARLIAQAALHGFAIPNAVMQKVFIEPKPFLLANQFKFPSLFVHRAGSSWSEKTLSWDHDAAEIVLTYLLPPLTQKQREDIEPILRGVEVAIKRATKLGRHSAYASGANVWKDLCALEGIWLASTKYDGMEPLQGNEQYYRALICTFIVREREMPDVRGYEALTGIDISVHERAGDGTQVDDVAVDRAHGPPELDSIAPNSGTKAGGTAVTLTGSGFRPGTHGRVVIGGADCDLVTIVSSTQVTARTPPHAAYPTAACDVYFIANDGSYDRLPAAFTFTSP